MITKTSLVRFERIVKARPSTSAISVNFAGLNNFNGDSIGIPEEKITVCRVVIEYFRQSVNTCGRQKCVKFVRAIRADRKVLGAYDAKIVQHTFGVLGQRVRVVMANDLEPVFASFEEGDLEADIWHMPARLLLEAQGLGVKGN